MTINEEGLLLANAIRSGDRSALAKGITLTESTLIEDRKRADNLLLEILPFSGQPSYMFHFLASSFVQH